MIVERYLDAKYYQYAPENIQEMSEYNSSATYLAESDQIVTLTAMETDDPSMLASLQDNLQELVNSVPEWEKETQSIHPKWLEHHQSGHLVNDPGCPVCMEEAGSKVNHRHKKVDRHPGIMHCDLAAFEASADGHKYCLVAAVTIEVDIVSKLLPFFVPMPEKDAASLHSVDPPYPQARSQGRQGSASLLLILRHEQPSAIQLQACLQA